MEDNIKTVESDLGKDTSISSNTIKGKRSVIGGLLYEWDGHNWIKVDESEEK